MKSFLSLLLGLLLAVPVPGQFTPAIEVPTQQLSHQGILLQEGWRWQAGDQPEWARIDLKDTVWSGIDPTTDIHHLPQIRQAKIAWFRFKLQLPSSQQVGIAVTQTGASEIYLDGQLVYQFGTVSADPSQEQTFNPHGRPISMMLTKGQHVLAIRYSCSSISPYLNYAGFGNPCLAVRIAAEPLAWNRFLYLREVWDVQGILHFGLLFILGLVHLSFYRLYPARKVNWYFGLYMLFFSLSCLADPVFFHLHSVKGQLVNSLIWYCVVAAGNLLLLVAIYELLHYPRRIIFRLICILCLLSLPMVILFYDWGWFMCSFFNYMLVSAETIRISIRRLSVKESAARVVLTGQLISLFFFLVMGLIQGSTDVNGDLSPQLEVIFRLSLSGSFLPIPIFIAIRLAREFAQASRSLEQKLGEVEQLSLQTLLQEQEKQQLLADQNQQLEQQVADRTAELSAQTRELLVAQDQLRQADAQKTRFFDNLTHEFRTPLTLILAPVQRLLMQLPNHEERTDLQTIERNARTLLGLINQLLDITRLEAKTMPLAESPGEIQTHTERVVDQFQPLARAKRIFLSYTCDPLEGLYWYDQEKWQKILFNLLSNALKFTPSQGYVRVHLERVRNQELNEQFRLVVEDTGIGISAQHLPFIFDRFYQADSSWTRHHEGSGIGLALVKELTELMGGHIQVASQRGETTFRLTMPLKPAETLRPSPIKNEPGEDVAFLPLAPQNRAINRLTLPETTQPLVLLVEDNVDLRDFLSTALSAFYRILTADNGQQGWELARRELPDLVLTDVMMPGMDGYTLTHQLKTDPTTDHIAVILLTARSAHQHVLEGLQMGADEYIPKPFQLEELHWRLHNLLTRQQRLREYYQQQFTRLPEESLGTSANEPANKSVQHPFLDNVYTLLDKHLDNSQLGVDWLADQLAMSRKTLYRKIVSLTPWPPNELIRRYRLRRGAERLRQGHSVAETAYLVGFDTPSYFGQCFKEVYGQSPSEFAQRVNSASPDRPCT